MKKPAPSMRIPGTIARDLGGKIVSGRLKPGKILDGEIAASGQRSVSRSAYREAMRILTAKGLVESRPKVGTRVSTLDKWHLLDPDVLSWMFQREPKAHLLVSLFELRKLVEPGAAALAARHRTPEHLAQMSEALAVMTRETLRTERGRSADQDFHASLLAASGNAFLETLSSSVTAAITWSTVFKQRRRGLSRDSVPDHRTVYEAIARKDSKGAHAAMLDLVELALVDITKVLRAKNK